MTEYTAVPTEELENWREAREQEMLNQITHFNREKREKEAHDIEANEKLVAYLDQAVRDEQFATTKHVATQAFLWIAGCAALILMAHTGAIAGWVMQIGTAAWSFALGMVIGQVTK